MRSGNLIIALGSLNADLTVHCERLPEPGETVPGHDFAVLPGGKSANQAVAAARLGAAVSLIGAVGEDAYGQMMLDAVAAAGVDVTHVRRVPGGTGVALISVDARGENSIIISAGANAAMVPGMIRPELFEGTGVLCLCLEIPVGTVLAAAQTARAAGVLVLLNFSPSPGNADAAAAQAVLGVTDVLLVNEHEAMDLLGYDPAKDWSEAHLGFRRLGVDRVVVTLGPGGSVVLDSGLGAPERVPAHSVSSAGAVDTTGAGDAFTGTVASVLADGGDLLAAAQRAAVVSALSVTKPGAQSSYPDAQEVAAAVEKLAEESGA